jgi:cellulose synthase operon protein C
MQHTVTPRFAFAALAIVAALATLGCGQQTAQSLVTEARADLGKGDAQAAIVRLKQALQTEPASNPARVLLGEALLASGDPVSAAVELAKSLESGAEPDQVMPLLARALLLSTQHRKLISTYANVQLRDAGAQAAFRTSLATAWALSGDKRKAEEALGAVLAGSPDFVPALLLKARFAASRGEYQPALQVVDGLLSRDSALYEGWHLKGEVHTYGLRDPKAGEPFFKKALEANKAHYPSQVELTKARILAGDLKGAKEQFELLRALAPSHVSTLFLQSQIAYFDKNFKMARELIQAVLRVQPDEVGALQMLSALEWQAGAYVLAARPLETALKIDPDLPDARTNLAYVYLRVGQANKALEILQPLIREQAAPPRALAAAAQASLQLNRLDDAEALYSRAAEASPGDAESRTALALTRLARGDAASAFAQLESLALQTKESLADSALISARLRRGELDPALAASQALLRKAPNSPVSHELLGRVRLARDELPAAREAFEKALSLDPRSLSAVANLAEVDVRSGQPQAALRRAEALATSEPDNFAAQLLLADVRRQTGVSADLVREALTRAVAAAPDEATPRVRLIEFLAGRRQMEAARSAAQEAVTAIPNNILILDALGQMQVAAGDLQQALSTFRSITSIDSESAGASVRMAEVHRLNGNLNAAVGELRRAVELNPQLREARIALMDILVQQKRSREALAIAKELQRRLPKSSAGYLFEGGVHGRLKNNDAAAAAYRLGLANAADRGDLALNYMGSLILGGKRSEGEKFALDWLSQNPGDGAIRYQLGEYYMGLGQMKAATLHFERALAARPDYAPALNNLSWLLAQQRSPGAVGLARRALALEPNNPAYLDTLATALAAEGKLAEAVEAQKLAVQVAPGDPVLKLRLAKLAMDAGDKALARSELQRILAVPANTAVNQEAALLMKRL